MHNSNTKCSWDKLWCKNRLKRRPSRLWTWKMANPLSKMQIRQLIRAMFYSSMPPQYRGRTIAELLCRFNRLLNWVKRWLILDSNSIVAKTIIRYKQFTILNNLNLALLRSTLSKRCPAEDNPVQSSCHNYRTRKSLAPSKSSRIVTSLAQVCS